MWDHSAEPIQWGAVLGASLAAAFIDLHTRRIPNLLTGSFLLGGLIWAGSIGGLAGLADAVAAAVILSVPYVLLFLFAGGGAGDAKMMAGIGAWLGVADGLVALAAVAAAGGVVGLLLGILRGRFRSILAHVYESFGVLMAAVVLRNPRIATSHPAGTRNHSDMLRMPYGVAIFIGVCLAAGGLELWRDV